MRRYLEPVNTGRQEGARAKDKLNGRIYAQRSDINAGQHLLLQIRVAHNSVA